MLSFNCSVYVALIHGLKVQIISRGYDLLHIVLSIEGTFKPISRLVELT